MQFEMEMDDLDRKLNETFDGKVVRKDLLHRIKKGTNVPTFVLEFLLARYCASNEPAEIQAGMEAVHPCSDVGRRIDRDPWLCPAREAEYRAGTEIAAAAHRCP